jgi:uncharacterized phosphosugar-binding protein
MYQQLNVIIITSIYFCIQQISKHNSGIVLSKSKDIVTGGVLEEQERVFMPYNSLFGCNLI